MRAYEMEVEWIRDLVGKDLLLVVDRDENASDRIMERLKKKRKEK